MSDGFNENVPSQSDSSEIISNLTPSAEDSISSEAKLEIPGEIASSNPIVASEPEVLSPPQQATISTPDPLDEAKRYVAEGKRDTAMDLVVQTLTDNPANPKALYLYAQLTVDKDNAIQALKNALQLQPAFFEAKLLLERLQAVLGSTETPKFEAPASSPTFTTAQPVQPAAPTSSSEPFMQQMLAQHQMLMQQQMVNQQQFTQQQLMNQQQLAQQQLMQNRGITALVAQTNGAAFWIGAIAAFFGFFGIAHMINGKIGAGVAYLILGFVWDVIAVTLAATLVGACVSVPLHLVFCYYNAKNGASTIGVAQGVTIQM